MTTKEVMEKSIFMRILHGICYLATCILTLVCYSAIAYQLYALYIPYLFRACLMGDETYRFPDYFYRVWGDSVTRLDYEHWGYLLAASLAAAFSSIYVLPQHPFKDDNVEEDKKEQ